MGGGGTGLGTTNSAETAGDASGSDSTDAGTGGNAGETDSNTSGSVYYDVGADPGDSSDTGAGCKCDDVAGFDYLWVADTSEGQLSKLDTDTMQEVARYMTRADTDGSPSRTSVSVDGKAVAVANRAGGVTKVWAELEDCLDTNGVAGIQTSSGTGDILGWGEDECVAWYAPMDGWTKNRPVAWGPGTFNEQTCTWEDQVVWTAGCINTQPVAAKLDGETGEVLADFVIEGGACGYAGPYGGAIDPDRNFWFSFNDNTHPLTRIDHETHEIKQWDLPITPPYGIAVDAKGRPWFNVYGDTGLVRFDPETETWANTVGDPQITPQKMGGLAQGAGGLIWTLSGTTGVVGVDPDTLQVEKVFESDTEVGRGISVDGKGRIWRVGGQAAVRFDPNTGDHATFTGYTFAYTYSDMTGFGLANAAGCAPEG